MSINHNFEDKGEPKRGVEPASFPLTSRAPYHQAKPTEVVDGAPFIMAKWRPSALLFVAPNPQERRKEQTSIGGSSPNSTLVAPV